ncbi:MAG: ABC transporter permease [Caldilineaceae bacterium]|nr:ABC transporter permease [Caldilineaceae bacterium]
MTSLFQQVRLTLGGERALVVPRQNQTRLVDPVRYMISENFLTTIAFALFVLLVFLALFGPWLAPYDPLMTDAANALAAPSAAHWFGTDQVGRDILSRVIVATRLDLGIALGAVSLSFTLGVLIGSLAGYYGGWLDQVVGRLVDTIMAFPLFVLAMGIVAALGNTVVNIVYATAIINLPFYIRLARAEVKVRAEAEFIEAARMSGNLDRRLLRIHMLPNILPPMMVQVSLNMGWAILNAAGLSFIGLGVRPPTAEWGIMVADGANFMVSGEWWLALFPGLALMCAVFCFNLLGDGLRDLIDPRRRS